MAVQQDIQRFSALVEAFKLDPQDLRGIRATPRKEGSSHGLFRGTLVKILKGVGSPITTAQILEALQGLNDSRLNLPKSRTDALHKIARDIRTISSYGSAVRYLACPPGSDIRSKVIYHCVLGA